DHPRGDPAGGGWSGREALGLRAPLGDHRSLPGQDHPRRSGPPAQPAVPRAEGRDGAGAARPARPGPGGRRRRAAHPPARTRDERPHPAGEAAPLHRRRRRRPAGGVIARDRRRRPARGPLRPGGDVRSFPQRPQGDVDNRTAIRPRAGQGRGGDRTGETAVAGSLRGPAYLAHQARTALGVGAPASGASAAPATGPAGLIGVAVAAVAVLARPEAVGPAATVACAVALGAVLALALRHSGATALALAVLLALVSVLGAGDNRAVGAAAVAIAAAVLAAAPHLGAVRAGDPRHRAVRLARELTGIGAVAAVLLVAMAPATPLGARVTLVTAVALLAGWDAVRGDGATRRR